MAHPTWELVMDWLPWGVAGFTLLGLVQFARARLSLIYIPRETADLKGTGREKWPSLSVLVPAKDEEEMVGQAVSSLLDLDYPNLQVVAINDRSTDRTGDILDDIQKEDPRLKVIHIEELPAGWLGKNHANHRGAQAADGEFILFTDGDVVHGPRSLKKAVAVMLRRDLDHMAGMPFMKLEGFWERLAVVGFAITFMLFIRPWTISGKRKKRNGDLGIGAFNLVRAEPYRKAGGHEPLAMEVADDIKLGRLMGRAGASQGLAALGKSTWLTWHRGMSGLFRGLEKNMFAGVAFSPLLAAGSIIGTLFMGIIPFLPLMALPRLEALGATALCLVILMGLASGTDVHGPWSFLYGLGFTVGTLFMAAVMVNSTWVTLRQGGIHWRDTFYSLDELRQGRYK